MEDYIKKTISFYNRNAQEFIKKTENIDDYSWLEKFSSRMPKKAKVLDLGCAYGRDTKKLCEKGFYVVGADRSEELIAEAKKRVRKASFHVQNLLDLHFNDDSFDGIWCAATILRIRKKHIPKALAQISRVLKPEGLLFLSLKKGRGEGFQPDSRYRNESRFTSYFSETEITGFLQDAGLKLVEIKTEVPNFHHIEGTEMIYLIACNNKNG